MKTVYRFVQFPITYLKVFLDQVNFANRADINRKHSGIQVNESAQNSHYVKPGVAIGFGLVQ